MPKYEGDRLGNLRHGRGRCYYPNGEIFEGEWKSDKVINFFKQRIIYKFCYIYFIYIQRHGYGILKD